MATGIEDILGVDGYLPDAAQSLVPPDHTMRHDLAQPLSLGRRFDIAQSLEVAEHLPSRAAEGFVASLVALSDFIVFGAAIPGQGGTGHINEQWHSYWSDLFARHDYEPVDALRPQAWYDPEVEWWYAQNTLIYVNRRNTALVEHVRQKAEAQARLLDVVHPRCFRQFRDQLGHVTLPSQVGDQAASLADKLSDPLPSRFRRPEYLMRLRSEAKPWTTYALRHPLRVTFWLDLRRLQRRRARAQGRSVQ
jgi:hypothetical protein